MDKAKVAIIKTKPETVLPDIAKVMLQAGFTEALAKDKVTILKENISWHFPFLSANTTPWQLEGVIQALDAAGYEQKVCVGNKTVVTNAFKGEKLNKLRPVLDKYRIPVKYNFVKGDMKWVRYEPKGTMLTLHKIFPEGIYIPDFFMGKNIVHLPTVKCHIYTGTTGAMKNAFGGLLNTKRHYTHSVIHETLVDLLTIQQEIHAGIFAVMDGTLAGNGPGPRTMLPVEMNYMLASSDSVAIDAVAARLMGFDPMNIPYIRIAHERGLGKGRMEEIEVVGEDISRAAWKFSVGDNLASRGGDLFWFGPFKMLQKLMFHTPLVYAFIWASFVYHDFFWWPFIGTRRMKDVMEANSWGRLFANYPD